ncbi:MAG: proton-conducting transporter membrane subunit, partial [Pseudomonadota bacterium]
AGLYLLTDAVQLDDVFAALLDVSDSGAVMLCAALIGLGAMAISAQILFHVWLPGAMEAPAPAAALLSAIFALGGVFVIWRLDPLLAEARMVQDVMVWVGLATAMVAGLAAAAQCDIKRTMGFVAASQLGLVFAVLGLGLGDGVHQKAHVQIPLFIGVQALLVLSVGAITRAMDDSRDMAGFGGLFAKLPIVAMAMILAAALATVFGFAQAGMGVLMPGPGNVVFASAYLLHPGAFWALCLGAGLGIFAVWRVVFLSFMGPSRAPDDVCDAISGCPRVMAAALMILGVLIVAFVVWQVGRLSGLSGLAGPDWLVWSPFACAAAGFVLALWFYVLQSGLPKALAGASGGAHGLLQDGFYLDRIYGAIIVKPCKALGGMMGGAVDGALDAPLTALSTRLSPQVDDILTRRYGVLLLCTACVVFFGLVAAITWSALSAGAA